MPDELKVVVCGYDAVVSKYGAQPEDLPNNGSGKEFASYLVVLHKGNVKYIISDAMEPEDARFYRDLKEVVDVIEAAYEWGISDEVCR